jgi:acyl transferase domain-containing protein
MPKRNVQKEPIAIVGIGCRFPGGSHSPQSFWEMLCEGKDAISEVPKDRWNVEAYYDPVPGKPGHSISKWGGFIEGIDRFDAFFFGISPREADWMDPQQRWLLEASAEALEDGGQVLDKLKGSKAGVFVGIATTDYSMLQSTLIEHTKADVYSATGGSISIAANRISYCFDLNGPSISMDTACSSALTAVHVGCQSLWKGDCSMALVAGVSALISPATFIAFSRMGMLSPDGRCKAFDASANGFVRGEGVGAIVLKPLSAAQSAGDKIYAVIRGTAANQDGRTNGLMLPSPIAQQRLVQEACRDAGISPAEVTYVEAHGTGTPVGDPIEAYALGTALGEGRSENDSCIVGSVKTNIGHLEAAAGIAGIIKTALVLNHGRIPPSLHFKNPNPHIDFAKLKLRVVQQIEPFPNGSGRMLAGINSFGFGGSNAHVILEAPPSPKAKKRKHVSANAPAQTAVLLSLSARSPEALQAVAKNYQALLSTTPGTNGSTPDAHSICRASAVRRTHHSHRLCAVGHSREELLESLTAFLAGETRPGLTVGQAAADPPPPAASTWQGEQPRRSAAQAGASTGPVFIFSGQGPQWWGMGRELMKQEPLFREKLDECDKLFKEFGGWSLLDELGRDEAESRLDQTAIAQPAIFALQIGLAALWQNWGVRPSAVIGHSVGEVAAAHLAGIYDLREAARIIFHRGRCMNVAPNGRMLAASLNMEQAKELVAGHGDRIAVAAFNSPNSVTLSGEQAILEGIAQSLEQRGVFSRFLQVHYAFHSAQMDPVKTELLQSLRDVTPNRAVLPFFSTVAGRQMDGPELTLDYWWRNVRDPVHFDAAVDGLIQQGHRCFVEISAHPALLLSISECLAHRSVAGVVLPSLRRQETERATMLGSLGALHVAGMPVDWETLYPEDGATVQLPQYPWQRERYWHEPEGHRGARLNRPDHAFMTRSLRASTPGWITWLDQEAYPFLNDHKVQGHVVFPGAGYIDTAFGVGKTLFGEVPLGLEDMDFQKALFLPESKEVVHLQTTYNPADLAVKFASRAGASNEEWTVNAVARLQALPHAAPPPTVNLEAVQKSPWSIELDGKVIYAGYEMLGLSYGPYFRGVETLWRRDGESFARVRLPKSILKGASNHAIHPALLDACFHALTLAIPTNNPLGRRMLLPVFIDRIRFFGSPGPVVWCHAKLVSLGSRFVTWNFQVLDETGRVLMDFEGFRSQAMAGSRATRMDLPEEWLYDSRWDLKPLPGSQVSSDAGTFLPDTSEIIKHLQQAGRRESSQLSRISQQEKMERGLNSVARAYLLEAFAKLSCTSRSDQPISTDSVLNRLKPPQSRAGVLRRYLSMREAQSDQPDSRRKGSRTPHQPDAAALWIKLLHQFPAALPELTLIKRVGCTMDKILLGEADAGKIISPEGSLTVLEHLYQDSVSQRDSNQAIAEAVAVALKNQPQDRIVRILEIGAGTGGLAAHVLPRLRPARTDYVFSDKDENLVSKAEQKFFDYPFVRYQRLDVEKDLAGQNFDGQTFDLIVACDTVCFTSDVRKSLGQIRSLLAPGGLLVLAERVRIPAWFGFVFRAGGRLAESLRC